MSQRRSSRPSQVRPRPPSSGRPKPASPRPRPSASRVPARATSKPRQPQLPLPAKGILSIGLVLLIGVVGLLALGGSRTIGSALGAAFGGLVDRVTATSAPSTTPVPILEPPELVGPADPYTNQAAVTLTGTLPAGAQGLADGSIRIYVSLAGAAPTLAKEIAIPPTAAFTVPDLALSPGSNDFTATLASGDAESDPSAVVTYVLDTEAPKVSIASPTDGSTVNRDSVQVKGQTQPLSELLAKNAANGATTSGTADGDGAYVLVLPLAGGTNAITVTATDPAGNVATADVTVRKGSGKLSADISASAYRIAKKSLPEPLTVKVVVTDPDGQALAGAQVLFTITIPGVAPIVPSPISTNASGAASFKTTIPKGATAGSGPITARITTSDFGELTVRTVVTITP
jgi:hypothetical protein